MQVCKFVCRCVGLSVCMHTSHFIRRISFLLVFFRSFLFISLRSFIRILFAPQYSVHFCIVISISYSNQRTECIICMRNYSYAVYPLHFGMFVVSVGSHFFLVPFKWKFLANESQVLARCFSFFFGLILNLFTANIKIELNRNSKCNKRLQTEPTMPRFPNALKLCARAIVRSIA